MIISQKGRFIFFAATKCASTTIETALAPHCSLWIKDPAELKHISVKGFERVFDTAVKKLGASDFTRYIVIREPIDWLQSWYRYRGREAIQARETSTADITWSEFVNAYLSDDKPRFARVGKATKMMRDTENNLAIHRIFAYEAIDLMAAELSERIGAELRFDRRTNVSPRREFDMTEEEKARLEDYFADEYEVYRNSIGYSR